MSPEDTDTHEPFRHGGRLGPPVVVDEVLEPFRHGGKLRPPMVVDVSVGAFPTWW